jgi:hypothetical protein
MPQVVYLPSLLSLNGMHYTENKHTEHHSVKTEINEMQPKNIEIVNDASEVFICFIKPSDKHIHMASVV